MRHSDAVQYCAWYGLGGTAARGWRRRVKGHCGGRPCGTAGPAVTRVLDGCLKTLGGSRGHGVVAWLRASGGDERYLASDWPGRAVRSMNRGKRAGPHRAGTTCDGWHGAQDERTGRRWRRATCRRAAAGTGRPHAGGVCYKDSSVMLLLVKTHISEAICRPSRAMSAAERSGACRTRALAAARA